MALLNRLFLRLFGQPLFLEKKTGQIQPSGIKHSIVPQQYLDDIKTWDSHLFKNQIIIK